METTTPPGIVLAGHQRLDQPLRALGVLGDDAKGGLVYDAAATVPQDWAELAGILDEVFRLTQQAIQAGRPVVYLVHEPSIWGHTEPLRGALATALLGGMRSAAVELARKQIAANAVALDGDDELERAANAVALLIGSGLSGQLLTCGAVHLGRPAA